MIHLICAANRHLYEDVLAEMHRARTEHFVKGRGWTNLIVEGGGEIDAYDDERALYLLGFEDDGSIAVSLRLLAADRGCLLADVFPHLVSEGPVSGPGIWELSRYFTAPAWRGTQGFTLKSRLNLAVLEALVARGATRLVGLTDLHILNMMRYSGWKVRPIGLPAEYDEGTAAAFEIACRPADLDDMRAILEMPARQLFEAPGWLPMGTDVRELAFAHDLVLNVPAGLRAGASRAICETVQGCRPRRDARALLARVGYTTKAA